MNIQPLIDAAQPWYDFNWGIRHYHNWGHARHVAETVSRMTGHSPSDSLLLAAWWHDAVYIPGAGSDANERCSAAALGATAGPISNEEDRETLFRAKFLIIGTSIEWHLTDQVLTGDNATLLDADLSSLAAPYETFIMYQDAIIEEAGGTPELHRKQSADFLQKFLVVRKNIYHTEFGRDIWESRARANIKRYATEVDNKPV